MGGIYKKYGFGENPGGGVLYSGKCWRVCPKLFPIKSHMLKE